MVEVTKEGRGLICEYYTTQGSVKQKRMNFVAKKKKKNMSRRKGVRGVKEGINRVDLWRRESECERGYRVMTVRDDGMKPSGSCSVSHLHIITS